MFTFKKIRSRLIVMGMTLSALPLVILSVVTVYQGNAMIRISENETSQLAINDLDHILKGVYAMCQAHQELVQVSVNNSLNVARDVLESSGEINLSLDTIEWDAVNQYNKESLHITLPRFMVGSRWIEKNSDMNVNSSVVDKIKRLVGGTCTIFQRMNDDGDMLRICTNVIQKDGRRAIGTYIPRTNPDGTPNPVVSTVLKGEIFRGRAYVVDRWYITAYAPIYEGSVSDSDDLEGKKIIGALYVGIPQESVSSLREAIMDLKVGDTGYVYVLDSKAAYVISKDGKRDGESLWDATDLKGDFPVRQIVGKALASSEGEIVEHMYDWKNPGDNHIRTKLARITYFKPWDWVIGVGSYTDELNKSTQKMKATGKKILETMGGIFAGILIVAFFIWIVVSKGISTPIIQSARYAETMADGDFSQSISFLQKDEISILGKSLNHVSKSLSEMIRIISDNTKALTESSTELNELAEKMKSGAEKTSRRSSSVATSANEMSLELSAVSASSEQASSSISLISTSTAQLTSTVKDISQNAEKARTIVLNAVSQAANASSKVDELGVATDEISKVNAVISDISEQTNLLALNATIEAARAGDVGKGFAVVANEIKELARQTAEATHVIKTRISGIQMSTHSTVQTIGGISAVINEVNDIISSIAAAIEEQLASTNEISENIFQTAQGIQEINDIIATSYRSSSDISKNIADVDKEALEFVESSNNLNTKAESLSAISEELKQRIEQFRISGKKT
ncbi:MAG: methyl-accepting chemotaxis protein [Proteobacteria bacterium]|nr:methyl-accepting chemotaxis protein [Pseudomonadota bacterium]